MRMKYLRKYFRKYAAKDCAEGSGAPWTCEKIGKKQRQKTPFSEIIPLTQREKRGAVGRCCENEQFLNEKLYT